MSLGQSVDWNVVKISSMSLGQLTEIVVKYTMMSLWPPRLELYSMMSLGQLMNNDAHGEILTPLGGRGTYAQISSNQCLFTS